VERLWHPKTEENSMFASDLTGRQNWMPERRRPEGLHFVRPGFQPEKLPLNCKRTPSERIEIGVFNLLQGWILVYKVPNVTQLPNSKNRHGPSFKRGAKTQLFSPNFVIHASKYGVGNALLTNTVSRSNVE
jgi:hypothetical protein